MNQPPINGSAELSGLKTYSPRRTTLYLFLGVFCAYALTASLNYAGYERETIDQARALLRGRAPKGRAGLFDVLIYAPFAAAGEALSRAGVAPVFRDFIPNLALAATMAAVVALVFLTALELFRPRAALGTALIFAFTTMAWPYSKMGMETGLTLATALAFYGLVLTGGGRSERGWALHALGLGLMLFTKTQAPVVIAMFAMCDAWLVWRGRSRAPSGRVLARAVPALLAAGALWLATNHIRHGHWLIGAQYSAKWEMARTPGYLFRLTGFALSPGKSILLYNPALIAALIMAPGLARRSPAFFAATAFVIVPHFLFHAWFRTWADETWGPRRLMNVVPLMILPVGAALEAIGAGLPRGAARWGAARRFAFGGIALVGFLFQLPAVSVNYSSVIWALQAAGLGTQRNLTWRVATAAPRIEMRIARSMIRRARGHGSLEMRLPGRWVGLGPNEYLPWNAPEAAPQASVDAFEEIDGAMIVLTMAPFDRSADFWWAQRRVQFADRRAWRDKPLWIAPLLMLGAGAGLIAAARGIRAEQWASNYAG